MQRRHQAHQPARAAPVAGGQRVRIRGQMLIEPHQRDTAVELAADENLPGRIITKTRGAGRHDSDDTPQRRGGSWRGHEALGRLMVTLRADGAAAAVVAGLGTEALATFFAPCYSILSTITRVGSGSCSPMTSKLISAHAAIPATIRNG